MNNSDLMWNIKIVIMKKKFDLFYEKYSNNFSDIDIRSTFFNEFEIKDDFSSEYVLFLNYLVKKWYGNEN